MKMENKTAQMSNITNESVFKILELDYLITALNYDQRGFCVFDTLLKNKKIKDVILLDYKKFRPDSNASEIMDFYKRSWSNDIEAISCDNEDDDVMFLNSQPITEDNIIGIDITNFCIPDLFRIIFVLKKIKNVKTIYAFYTEPKYYLQHYHIWENDDSLDNERDFKVLEEYFVSATPENTLLVCFLGFEYLVSKYVSENANTKDTVVINGFPSYYPKLKDISLANNYELVSTLSRKNIYCSAANDPFSAYNTLMEIQKNYPGYVLNLCVLGTKPMALGACIYALENEGKVKVSYPIPKTYKVATSKEASNMWYYVI